MKKQTGTFLPLLLTTVIAGLAGAVQASVDVPSGVVGEVTLVVGKAWIRHSGAEREPVRRGTRISVSDAIETSTGGRVHIRFVDNALVAVRPASTLEILRYEYDPANPAQSAVKVELVEGVARSVSGDAAKSAPENYRLNTPIAAIGVRGTDFVVSADRNSVRALVTEGAIVVTRFSNDCLADALGPCSQNGFELAGGARQIMQLTANARDPVLLPIAGLPQAATGTTTAADDTQSDREESASGDLYADTVTTRAVNQTIAVTRAAGAPVPPPPPVPPAPPEFTPDAPLGTAALTVAKQLVWGRYTSAFNERITAPYEPGVVPFAGLEVTVGNNHYALFRLESGSKVVVQPGLGVVGFSLDRAQAQFTAAGATSLMDVNGGNLSIDFDQNLFTTSLNLSHAATGAVNLVDSGRIFAGGYFHSRSDTQVVAGAVSLDGKEAGYFFEKTLENGYIEGLTLWGRQP